MTGKKARLVPRKGCCHHVQVEKLLYVIMREKGSSDSMIQSSMIMAYTRAYALYLAKVAYATLRDPVI